MVQPAEEIFQPFLARIDALDDRYAETKPYLHKMVVLFQENVAICERVEKRIAQELESPQRYKTPEAQLVLFADQLGEIAKHQENNTVSVSLRESDAGLEPFVKEVLTCQQETFAAHLKTCADRMVMHCRTWKNAGELMEFSSLGTLIDNNDKGLPEKERQAAWAFYRATETGLDALKKASGKMHDNIGEELTASRSNVRTALNQSAQAVGATGDLIRLLKSKMEENYLKALTNITPETADAPEAKSESKSAKGFLDYIQQVALREMWECAAGLAKDVQHYYGQSQKGKDETIELPPTWITGNMRSIGNNGPGQGRFGPN